MKILSDGQALVIHTLFHKETFLSPYMFKSYTGKVIVTIVGSKGYSGFEGQEKGGTENFSVNVCGVLILQIVDFYRLVVK